MDLLSVQWIEKVGQHSFMGVLDGCQYTDYTTIVRILEYHLSGYWMKYVQAVLQILVHTENHILLKMPNFTITGR